MPNLGTQLAGLLRGSVSVVGVGNVDRGDDGFGVRLAEQWPASACGAGAFEGSNRETESRPAVLIAGLTPERHLTHLIEGGYDTVLFLDAVEFGGPAGAVTLLNAEQMAARFPQVSTHRLSLGILARLIEENGHTQVYLLGVQPGNLRPMAPLSPAVQRTLQLLAGLVRKPGEGAAADAVNRSEPWTDSNRSATCRSPLQPC